MSRLDFLRMEARQELDGLLQDALETLEAMPQGGIGVHGYSLEDIQEAEELGQVVTNDAAYHQAQKAWLLINDAIEKLEEI